MTETTTAPRTLPPCAIGHIPPARLAHCLACRRRDLVAYHVVALDRLRKIAELEVGREGAARAAVAIATCYYDDGTATELGLEAARDFNAEVAADAELAIRDAADDLSVTERQFLRDGTPAPWRATAAELRAEVRRQVAGGAIDAEHTLARAVLEHREAVSHG